MFKDFIVCKNLISKSLSNFLYEYLKFSTLISLNGDILNSKGDNTVPNALGCRGADMTFDTLLKTLIPKIEKLTDTELYPTYSYARIYQTGNKLIPHIDRPACEISVTIKLGDNGKGNWPIYMKNEKILLENGDGVIYQGCKIEHQRKICDIPNYYMGQLFLHYVDKNGPNLEYRYDKFYEREKFFIKSFLDE
jgi:hypothetical protein